MFKILSFVKGTKAHAAADRETESGNPERFAGICNVLCRVFIGFNSWVLESLPTGIMSLGS